MAASAPAHCRSRAADPAPITIVVFTPPSLGAIFPAVIKQQKFDIANGIDITFVERPPDAYAAEFNSGEFQVGGSASVLIVGLGTTRGIKASYLFNHVRLLGHGGHQPAGHQDARRSQGQADCRRAGARRITRCSRGLRNSKASTRNSLQVVNTATPGLVGYALADRADAVQNVGAGLYAGEGRAARHPHHRSQYREGVA